jgi:hypothetical protein
MTRDRHLFEWTTTTTTKSVCYIDDLDSRALFSKNIVDHFDNQFEAFEFELNIYTALRRRCRGLLRRLDFDQNYLTICMH